MAGRLKPLQFMYLIRYIIVLEPEKLKADETNTSPMLQNPENKEREASNL